MVKANSYLSFPNSTLILLALVTFVTYQAQ